MLTATRHDFPAIGKSGVMAGTFLTGIDLYRIGDARGPALEAVRPGIDVVVRSFDGVDFVTQTPDGGASTRSDTYALRRATSRWRRLPAGCVYSRRLVIRNDHGHHWLIEPATMMPLSAYRDLLRALGALFL